MVVTPPEVLIVHPPPETIVWLGVVSALIDRIGGGTLDAIVVTPPVVVTEIARPPVNVWAVAVLPFMDVTADGCPV